MYRNVWWSETNFTNLWQFDYLLQLPPPEDFATARKRLVERWLRNPAYDSLCPVYIDPADPTLYVALTVPIFNQWANEWVRALNLLCDQSDANQIFLHSIMPSGT